jgi:hypothetical protein
MNQPEIDPPMGESDGRVVCDHATIGWPAEEKEEGDDTPSLAFTLKNLNFEPPQGQMTIVCGPLGSGKTLLVSHYHELLLIASCEDYSEKLESWRARCWHPEPRLTLYHSTVARFTEIGPTNLG